ncbi:MAG: hypothetical protein WC299_01245 [Kiritimatiellia bacterium]
MKRLILITLAVGLGNFSAPALIGAEVTAQESLYYEEIYNEYNQIVSEAIEQNADIKSITEEYFKTINQKPFVIHISKILGNHKSEIVFQWFDKDTLILLPHIHYGPKPKTVHVRKLSSNGIEYVLIETNLLPMLRETNRVQPDEIRLYIRMAIKINKL